MRRLFTLAFCLLPSAFSLYAQTPAEDWRTIKTEHFRIHYPAPYVEWTQRVASRIESVRDAVVKEVGYAPPQVIDIVIANPVAEPNGLAISLLNAPRIVLYTDPPGPTEEIGEFREWAEILMVHEYTHQAHTLRPSRNPLRHLGERFLLALGPITLGSPRWVLEGYATVIEGRLSLARPNGAIRAVVLRKWALEGRLPAYDELDSDRRFLGMSMAYLAGSSYLEWLERRSGPDSLRKLWARMTARRTRSFDQSFEGVFGETPERLYRQYLAELTAESVREVREMKPREGELWQETKSGSGSPVVSPDGKKIAIVIAPELRERRRNPNAKLVILSTEPPEKEEKEFQERIDKILARDPEDVGPVRTKPLPRDPIDSLTMPDGGEVDSPRWTRDGRAIVFTHRVPDLDGVLHKDLFRWIPATGELKRLTHLADVSEADLFPDGTAVAVSNDRGRSMLVRVNEQGGRPIALTQPYVDRIYSHPRLNADGSRLAYVVHRDGLWRLVIRDLNRIEDSEIDLGPGTSAAEPEWSRTNPEELDFVAIGEGRMEIRRLRAGGTQEEVTRSSGAAISPAPSPDGRLFFMGLEPDGYVVRVTNERDAAPWTERGIARPERATFAERETGPAAKYGIGRQELNIISAENFAPSGNALEIGARVGDVIGRLDTLAIASFGHRDAVRGVALASAWRGWPVAVSAHLFRADEASSELRGAEVRAWRRLIFPNQRFDVAAGALFANEARRYAFAELSARQRVIRPSTRIDGRITVGGEIGSDWRHARGDARIAARLGGLSFALEHERHHADDQAFVSVGGLGSTILPASAYAGRVLDPALGPGILAGNRYHGSRAEILFGSASIFYQRHVIGRALALVGLQLETSTDPVPLVRLPGFTLTAGVARILDEPLRGRTRAWFGIRYTP